MTYNLQAGFLQQRRVDSVSGGGNGRYVSVILQGQKYSPNVVACSPKGSLLAPAKCSTFALFSVEFDKGRTRSQKQLSLNHFFLSIPHGIQEIVLVKLSGLGLSGFK